MKSKTNIVLFGAGMAVVALPAFATSEITSTGAESQRLLTMAVSVPIELHAGVTTVLQNMDDGSATDSAAAYSLDLALGAELSLGNAFIRLNTAEGRSVNTGAYSIANADDETGGYAVGGYQDTRVAEAWLALPLGERATLTLGKMDSAGIYDHSELAHDETSQFLNSAFVNNPAIDFPGYSAGLNLAANVTENIALSVGVFEPSRDFQGDLADSFVIAEAAFSAQSLAGHTHVRVIGWTCDACPSATAVTGYSNTGYALNADHAFNDTFAMFGRFGRMDKDPKGFDRAMSLGARWAQDKHEIGAAYSVLGATGVGREDEIQMEVYYKYAVSDNMYVTLDAQSAQNPGFSATADNATVIGTRLRLDL